MNTDIELSYIMPIFFNQENAKVLIDLLTTYSNYDEKIVSKIQFVLVDDASPIAIEIPADVKINYHLLRITDYIEWNQVGARNLGIVYSKSDKIIVADCDHIFPENLLRSILKSKTPHKTLYEFKRVDSEGKKENAHQNYFTHLKL